MDDIGVLDWFEHVTGFSEYTDGRTDGDAVRAKLELTDGVLRSRCSERTYRAGFFNVVELRELRERVKAMLADAASPVHRGAVTVRHKVGDAMVEHADPANNGCCFQVASQANCLEGASRKHGPEFGLTQIIGDYTQGPACAMACGAGSIARLYLIDMPSGRKGQSMEEQVNLFRGVERAMDNDTHNFFSVVNGYATAVGETKEDQTESLRRMNAMLSDPDAAPALKQRVRDSVCVGLQQGAQVVFAQRGEAGLIPLDRSDQLVTQVLCSAVSFQGVSDEHRDLWEPLAREVLAGGYEATLWAAAAEGMRRVSLTFVGGGAFANKKEWIIDGVNSAVHALSEAGVAMEVCMVHFRAVDPVLEAAIRVGAPPGAAAASFAPWVCKNALPDGSECGCENEALSGTCVFCQGPRPAG
eukprot:TRINITY_DN60196_c0_g1_i1.p1 TRINITY_DN60196_c0_g1~~TRINITY_DN60196_c0_g1_i1.p1  ORF type:complete len:414 (+),score=141.41 TRINITY_DN60196_c0_g1_i1:92-1333(+)